MKKIVFVFTGLIVAALIAAGAVFGPYATRVQHIQADTTAGFHADFYLYVSPSARSRAASGGMVTILVQPNNSGTNSDDPAVHRRDAWWTGFERKRLADELGVALLVPAFLRPAKDWKIYTHALDRDVMTTGRTDLARLDLQLIAMIDAARARLRRDGISTDERVLIQGFSASGMFANRFAALHPGRVKGVTAGAPGGWAVAPLAEWAGERLPYPVGIADVGELTGTPFDSAAYAGIPQLIYVGSLDDNDSVDFTDGWDEEASALIDRLFGIHPLSRWEISQTLYRHAGANVRFLLVEGVGHDRRALQDSSTAFFARLLASESGPR